MQVTHGSLGTSNQRHAITIGNFDGVHLGHQAMLAHVRQQANRLGVAACALTFEPHPREFFFAQSPAREGQTAPPARLMRLSQKLAALRAAGMDRVHIARFDRAFAALSPEACIDRVLVRGLGCAWLMVGRDFRFGAKRAGDLSTLQAAALQHHFEIDSMPDVLQNDARISSSRVRASLQAGDLSEAADLLGASYAVTARVIHGEKLGRTLGFATANLPLPPTPALSGIFVVQVLGVPGRAGPQPAVASVGLRPTVNALQRPLLEVHLLDYDGDLYGQRLTVRFLHRLRGEEKYVGLDALRAAIATDVLNARRFFANDNHG